ncbi:hypothetical protein FB465_0558 [Kitasatospora atroaurantiaca]|uniref:Transposase n=1 Tax=Kitasatospora atroaurantiaca TaxID=285545 RepID=A0A561EJ45_9ACTN|nr:hypothetical protein FB465_0558 [Kitasatospora atroaurantiaca]
MVMKHCPPEFKADAVALYESRPGSTIKSVADDLGNRPGDPAELDPGGRQAHAPGRPGSPACDCGDHAAPPPRSAPSTSATSPTCPSAPAASSTWRPSSTWHPGAWPAGRRPTTRAPTWSSTPCTRRTHPHQPDRSRPAHRPRKSIHQPRAFTDACRRAGVRQSMGAAAAARTTQRPRASTPLSNGSCCKDAEAGPRARGPSGGLPLGTPLQHRPTPLQPRTPQPHRLRDGTQHNINYPDQSRIARVQHPGSRPTNDQKPARSRSGNTNLHCHIREL